MPFFSYPGQHFCPSSRFNSSLQLENSSDLFPQLAAPTLRHLTKAPEAYAEYDPVNDIAWGYVIGNEKEFGTFSIEEIRNLKGPFGLKVEREKWFESTKEKELMEKIKKGIC